MCVWNSGEFSATAHNLSGIGGQDGDGVCADERRFDDYCSSSVPS